MARLLAGGPLTQGYDAKNPEVLWPVRRSSSALRYMVSKTDAVASCFASRSTLETILRHDRMSGLDPASFASSMAIL